MVHATRMLYVCVVHAMQMWYVCIVHAMQRWGMCVQMQCECGMRVRDMQHRGGVCVWCMLHRRDKFVLRVPCVQGSKVSLREWGGIIIVCGSEEGSPLFTRVERDYDRSHSLSRIACFPQLLCVGIVCPEQSYQSSGRVLFSNESHVLMQPTRTGRMSRRI